MSNPKYAIGDRVRKHSGTWWEGRIVGGYSTSQTDVGYAIQLDMVPNGPVQIYPEAALSPAKDSPTSHLGGIEAAQITMGRGLVDVTRIDHEGRSGILFRPRDQHIPIGEGGELQAGEYWPVAGDVVIWIENEAGASVIQKYLAPFLPAQSQVMGPDVVDKATAWDQAVNSGQRARAKALEESAQIAETGDFYGEFQTQDDERRAKAIAARIRALATKEASDAE